MPTKQQILEMAKKAAIGAAAAALQGYLADNQITSEEAQPAAHAARAVLQENESLRVEVAELKELLAKALNVMKTGTNSEVHRFLQAHQRFM